MRLLYGINPVLEALRARPGDIRRVLLERGRDGKRSAGQERVVEAAHTAHIKIEDVASGDLHRRSHGGVHQGVAAELAEFEYKEMDDLFQLAQASPPGLIVVLDGVTDPQNLGALIRSSHALGAHGVVIPKDRAAGVTPLVAKAAAGALEHSAIAQVTNVTRAVEQLKAEGFWTVALAGEGTESLPDLDLTSPIALVMGAEGSGVRPLVQKTCDHVARIPMAGQIGSLNVSAAGAIALYEVARQRSAK